MKTWLRFTLANTNQVRREAAGSMQLHREAADIAVGVIKAVVQ